VTSNQESVSNSLRIRQKKNHTQFPSSEVSAQGLLQGLDCPGTPPMIGNLLIRRDLHEDVPKSWLDMARFLLSNSTSHLAIHDM